MGTDVRIRRQGTFGLYKIMRENLKMTINLKCQQILQQHFFLLEILIEQSKFEYIPNKVQIQQWLIINGNG